MSRPLMELVPRRTAEIARSPGGPGLKLAIGLAHLLGLPSTAVRTTVTPRSMHDASELTAWQLVVQGLVDTATTEFVRPIRCRLTPPPTEWPSRHSTGGPHQTKPQPLPWERACAAPFLDAEASARRSNSHLLNTHHRVASAARTRTRGIATLPQLIGSRRPGTIP